MRCILLNLFIDEQGRGATWVVDKHSLKDIPEEIIVYRVPRRASAQRLIAVGSD